MEDDFRDLIGDEFISEKPAYPSHAGRRKGQRGKRKDSQIVLPHAWRPRPWQAEVLAAMQKGIKRFLIVVHRRGGKDQVALNMAAIASQQRVGQYWHVLPYNTQVKKHIWAGMDKQTGVRFIDQAFPQALRAATRHNACEIEFTNGSLWTGLGSDNYEALRGGNPVFIAFSEAAFADPEAWTRMSPIVRENDGIAAFISTPFGRNWFFRLYEAVKDNPNWFVRVLTVDDTRDWDGNPLITPEMVEAERDEGMDEAAIRREYYCDWSANITGAYYAAELERMRKEGRICTVDHDPKRPVYCAWDLGYSDELVALMFQKNGNAHYCIGSRTWQFTKLQDALAELPIVFPWSVEKHFLPHDAASQTARDLLLQAFEDFGEAEILDRSNVHPGIQCVRSMLPTLWIDDAKRDWAPTGNNERLIEAIGTYRSRQTRTGIASSTPVHDWSSHYADALRYYALANAGELTSPSKWGPAPNYDVADRVAATLV